MQSRCTGRLAVVAIAAMALGAPSGAGAADRIIATSIAEEPLSNLTAGGGVVVWTRDLDPAGETSELVRRAKGRNGLLPLGTFTGSVDADLGPARRGGLAAVYDQCTDYCDLFSFSLRSLRERRIAGLSLPGRSSEHSASVWKGRIAFTRKGAGLFVGFRRARRVSRLEPIETDLRGRRVAFLTLEGVGEPVSTIWLKRFDRRGRGRTCRIAEARDTADPQHAELSNPVLTKTHVLWLREDTLAGVPSFGIHRRRLPSPTCAPGGTEEASRTLAGGPDAKVQSFALTRGRVYYSALTEIRQADPPLTFAP